MGLIKHLMSRIGSRHLFRYAAPLILIVIFLFLFPYYSREKQFDLYVYNVREKEVIYRLPIKDGETFSLTYTHSVTKTPVEGTFAATPKGLIQPLTTSFDTFGPGLPDMDRSTPYSLENGRIVVQHREEPRENIRIWVSSLTNEQLFVGNRQLPLAHPHEDPVLLEIYLLPRQR